MDDGKRDDGRGRRVVDDERGRTSDDERGRTSDDRRGRNGDDDVTRVLARLLEGRLRDAFARFCADIPQILRSMPQPPRAEDEGARVTDEGADFVRALLEWIAGASTRSERASRYLLMWYAKSTAEKGAHRLPDGPAVAELVRVRLTSAELADVDLALRANWDALRYGGSLKTLASRQRKAFMSSLTSEQTKRFAPYLTALLPVIVLPAATVGAAHAAIRAGDATATTTSTAAKVSASTWAARVAVMAGLPFLAGVSWYVVRGEASAERRLEPVVPDRRNDDRPDLRAPVSPRAVAAVVDVEGAEEYVPTGGPGTERAKFGNRPPRLKWKRQVSGVSSALYAIHWSGTKAVAVGADGVILSSSDGVVWQSATLPAKYWIGDVTFGTTWVATGTKRWGTFGGRLTLVSDDGVHWTPKSEPEMYSLSRVTAGAGVYVALGHSSILTSRDGLDWTVTSTGVGEFLGGIRHDLGTFRVVTSKDRLLTSSDGWSWSLADAGSPPMPRGVFHAVTGHGIDVAVGQERPATEPAYGFARRSTDHVTWTEQRLPDVEMLAAVVFDGNEFVAVGDGIFSSIDGQEWSLEVPGDELSGTDIALAGDTLIAIGQRGAIFTAKAGAR